MIIDAHQLDRDSPVPLWYQIAELLRDAVESGRIAPGERLDNEIELSDRLGVSRPTVRQAIQALVQRDLVVRRRGVGTIVAARRIRRPVALTSLYDDLNSSGRNPTTEVLSIREAVADPDIAEELAIASGDAVIEIERLRLADGAPLALMHNTIPAKVLAVPLDTTSLATRGLYDALREQGIRFHSAYQVIGARTATAREARLLKASRSTTVLTMTRTALDATGIAIEVGRHCYLANHYSFEISLSLK